MSGFRGFARSAGVTLGIFSLPSEYGIGCFSSDAEAFAELISDMGFHWWQILPLTAPGAGNSPYGGHSAFAGNRLYVCPAALKEQGLLSESEAAACKYAGEPYRADYDFARLNSEKYLRLAFSRLNEEISEDIREFERREGDWLFDYALFMALAADRSTCWWRWEEPLKYRRPDALEAAMWEYKDDVDFYIFEQYEFFRQWDILKKKINKRGVDIIGDMPFYLSLESADVWARPELFQLDDNMFPRAIAGVPPSAFSKEVQVLGNVLYDFDNMRKDGYRWWRRRTSHCLRLYDALVLDHFRGFYNYYAIPVCDYLTAANGRLEEGPGEELLSLMREDNKNALFIAEDLGDMDEDCRKFILSEGIPTMRVFQFGFDGTPSMHIPYRYEPNTVAYSGTHDNNTLLGWLYELGDSTRDYVLEYCGFQGAGWGAGGPNCGSTKAIVKTLMMSSSCLLVLPFQDLLGYGGDARINVPGTLEGNWTFRLPYHLMATVDRDFYHNLISVYGRRGRGGV